MVRPPDGLPKITWPVGVLRGEVEYLPDGIGIASDEPHYLTIEVNGEEHFTVLDCNAPRRERFAGEIQQNPLLLMQVVKLCSRKTFGLGRLETPLDQREPRPHPNVKGERSYLRPQGSVVPLRRKVVLVEVVTQDSRVYIASTSRTLGGELNKCIPQECAALQNGNKISVSSVEELHVVWFEIKLTPAVTFFQQEIRHPFIGRQRPRTNIVGLAAQPEVERGRLNLAGCDQELVVA